MAILSEEQIEKVKLANVDYHGAASELVAVCRMAFKPGTEIRWRKNNHAQSGIVVFWNGTAAYPTIRVENHRTGKVYEISLHDVVLGTKRQMVKQYGNAVTPPVMQMIIERCMATFGKVN